MHTSTSGSNKLDTKSPMWHSDNSELMLTSVDKKEDFIFWKNIIVVVVFLSLTPIVLGMSLFSLISIKNAKAAVVALPPSIANQPTIYAPLENTTAAIDGNVVASDARPEIVKQYLENYNSPLVSYANLLVSDADKYGIDFRLTTAIAQQESNLCKVIPPNSYNCWGWGITSESSLGFNSFEEGIDTVSKGLKTQYFDKGYTTIPDIMSKYTPSSNGSWADGVSKFMGEME